MFIENNKHLYNILTPDWLYWGGLDDFVILLQAFNTSGFFWHTASLPSCNKNDLEYTFFPVGFVTLHCPIDVKIYDTNYYMDDILSWHFFFFFFGISM